MTRYPALVLLTALPGAALALGLGDIQLNSALNQPLNAEIEIVGATPEELRELRASVAPRETFVRYGLEYPQFLSTLKFRVDTNAAGQQVLRVTSGNAISEPFLTFLLEADWDSGRLLREYTVLLDPPVFMAGPAEAPVPVAPPRGAAAQPAPGAGRIERPVAAPPPPEPEAPPVRPATVAEPVKRVPPMRDNGTEYGPVRRGDTLWGIANRLRPEGVSVNQMMIALYQANPEAFINNINLLKEGSVLQLPAAASAAALSRGEATAEVQRQVDAWRGRSSAGGSQSALAAAAGAGSEAARLRLVAPEEAGAADGRDAGAGSAALAAQARDTIERQQNENRQLGTRVETLESELAEARRLIALQDTQLADLQGQLATAGTEPAAEPAPADGALGGVGVDLEEAAPGSATAAVSGDTGTEAVVEEAAPLAAPAAPGAEAAPAPVKAAAQQDSGGWLDALLGLMKSTWLWIALGLTSILAAAVIALNGRRRASAAAEELEALANEQDASADTQPTRIVSRDTEESGDDEPAVAVDAGAADKVEGRAVDTGVFEGTGTFRPIDFEEALQESTGDSGSYPFDDSVPSTVSLDQSDPVSEADFHMAYGLYDQAADLVKKALAREPGRRDLQLKLLEIFFVWGNRDEFLHHARELREPLMRADEAEWDKIVIMGKQICPEDPLFSGDTRRAAAAEGTVDIDLEGSGETAMSMDLETAPAAQASDEDDMLDLDLGDALAANSDVQTTRVSSASDLMSSTGALDFDLDTGANLTQSDAELNEIARKLEARMTSTAKPSGRGEDIGMSLDLGQTIAPETTIETATLTSADGADGDDDSAEIFGDFFAFTGVVEDTSEDTRPAEIALETTGELLPESPTGEFQIDLPDDMAGVDLDIGDAGADLPDDDATLRDAVAELDELPGMESDTATLPASTAGESVTVPSAGILRDVASSAEAKSSGGRTANVARSEKDIQTVQAPIVGFDPADGFVSSTDETVAANSLDLDVGFAEEDEDRPTTVKVAAAELALPEGSDDGLDEVGTKLDLARAYIDMGDSDGARSILEEVIEEGDQVQRDDAQGLLRSIAS